VSLAPNDADGYETLAEVFGWGGRPEESITMIQRAMRLNPHYPFFYLWTLGHGYYLADRKQEALATLDKVAAANPNFIGAQAYRAVLYGELGREREARAAWDRTRELIPTASLATLRERLPYRRQSDLDRLIGAAARAGLR